MAIGLLARHCCIFRVDKIIVYDVLEHWKQKQYDVEFVVDVLTYLSTPQYLRRKVIPRKHTLEFAGILPPLNIPAHPVDKDPLEKQLQREGIIYRVGAIESITRDVMHVDVGLDQPLALHAITGARVNDLVSVRVERVNENIIATVVPKKEVPCYWGYEVLTDARPFQELLGDARRRGVAVATSKTGRDFRDFLKPKETVYRPHPSNLSIFFGPRKRGLSEFFNTTHQLLASFDAVINFFPETPTKTIRLEEAIPVSLAFVQLLEFKEKERT